MLLSSQSQEGNFHGSVTTGNFHKLRPTVKFHACSRNQKRDFAWEKAFSVGLYTKENGILPWLQPFNSKKLESSVPFLVPGLY